MHVIGTAGHVDHGKSTLVERLTGIDPDRFEEEKRRGLTIDLGFAWLTLPSGNEIGIVDVPGHERFIKNMLAGAGGVSICLFVVAANEGWKPQSAEHLAILDVLGVSSGVVAVTKSDTVDEETLEIALAEIEERLTGSSLAGAPIVAVSAVTGTGIDRLLAELDAVVASTPSPPDLQRPRLWVDRVFTIAGAGTVVTGTLYGGSLAVGDEVEIVPEGRRARVRSIQSHKRQVDAIAPGNRTALNLAGLERQGAERGDAVVKPGMWRSTRLVDAEIRVLDPAISGREHELTEKGAHLLYAGSAETPVRLRLLGDRKIGPGGIGYAQIELRDALPLGRGDRFVLRDAGRVLTFGGGIVLDPLARPVRRSDESYAAGLRAAAGASPEAALEALVRTEGMIRLDEALARSGAASAAPGESQVLGHWLVSEERYREIVAGLERALSEHHAANPLESGMPREAARTATGLDPGAFDALVETAERLTGEGSVVRLTTHRVELDAARSQERDELLARLEASGFTPPVEKELDVDSALLRLLVTSGELVKIADFYLTKTRSEEVRSKVRSAIEDSGPLTVAAIRDLLGTTRRYAVPLCEWLDATGATRRQGDVRALGPRP